MTRTQRAAVRTLIQTAIAAIVAFGLLPADTAEVVTGLAFAILSTVAAFLDNAAEDRTGEPLSRVHRGE